MVEGRLFEIQGHALEYLRRCLFEWDLHGAFLVECDGGWLVLFVEDETHLGAVG